MSGSGKSTLTDIIMGLHDIDKGKILINDKIDLNNEKKIGKN